MIEVHRYATKMENAAAAAAAGARAIQQAIEQRGRANIVVATGASQFEMLDSLVARHDVDWSKVTGFHLDEYIDMPETHPASFRKYLKERFTGKLPTLGAFHFIKGDTGDVTAEIARVNALLDAHPIDLTFAGIGENGHLAFNDPPADFTTTDAYKIVDLDEACRRQQFGEGWFKTFDAVPDVAISMTVHRIMSSRAIILTVPDERKASAVQRVLEGPVTNMCPASILQTHPACQLFIDDAAASKLSRR